MAHQGPVEVKTGAGASPGGAVLLLEASCSDLAETVELIFRRFPLSLSGARVLVKPNMLGPYKPEKAVTTDPALVSAVVDYLVSAGADPVVGDNPGARGYGISRKCGEITGIAAAARGRFVNIGEESVEVGIDSPFTQKARVSRAVMDADMVISLPKLKTHVQTIMTGGIKNTFGYLIGAEKSRIHSLARTSRDFGRILVDIFSIRPPDLTIMDAILAMEGDGPSSGRPREVGRIIASTDTPAVDVVASRLIGLEPEDVAYLREALGRWPDWGRPGEVGPAELAPVPGFALPRSFIHGVKSYMANWLVFSFLKKSRLRIRADLCTACGTCEESCPVGAMKIEDGKPVIDREACIACYCCHELCPRGAVELTPYVRSLLRGRG